MGIEEAYVLFTVAKAGQGLATIVQGFPFATRSGAEAALGFLREKDRHEAVAATIIDDHEAE